MGRTRKLNEGDRAIRFVENLKLVGDYQGQPLVLRPWQRKIIRILFGTIRKDGLRQYKRCFLALPRKNAKTALCAAIAIYCLIGTGKTGQEIYSCAASREQAAIVFKYASQMIQQDPYLTKLCTIYQNTKRIVVERYGNTYTALSADAHTAHGLSPSVVICDEVHAWPSRELWDVMASGFGARKEPLTIGITTAGTDRSSFCYEEWEYAKKVRDKVITDPTYLPLIYQADEDDDWTSEKIWHKAMPALGDFCSLEFIRDEYKRAQELPAEESKFRRLYLNQWVAAESRFIPRNLWDACKVTIDLEALQGRDCWGGIDLSEIGDITAFVLVFPDDDGTITVLPHFWIPREAAEQKQRRDRVPYLTWEKQKLLQTTPGRAVDYDRVRDDILGIIGTYNLKRIFIDPCNSHQIAIKLIEEDGLPVERFSQNMTNVNAPTKELLRLVLTGKLRHNSAVLTWMADNAISRTDANGNLRIDKAHSRQKVDGLSATVNALGAYISDNLSVISQGIIDLTPSPR